jgi:circadian clock protein KaiC
MVNDRLLERITSGVPGLDEVLGGGFLRGGVYLVLGVPGSGKTILANQLAFHRAQRGERVLYVSVLAESYARLFAHLERLAFFDEMHVASTIHYVSAYNALEEAGLQGLLDILRLELRERQASVLVLDGLVSAEAFAQTGLAFKKFIHELQTLLSLVGCTAFLLTSGIDPLLARPEHTMVDGLIEIGSELLDTRPLRALHVRKFRGGPHLGGTHALSIGDGGVRVFPRLEALVEARPFDPRAGEPPLSTGIARLDSLLRGGVQPGSSTLVIGPPGTGKTILGLHFLEEGLRAGEPALYFGFHEPPERLLANAAGLGLDLRPHLDRGLLEMVWSPNTDALADEIGHRLLECVRGKPKRRLVLDSVAGLRSSIIRGDRLGRYLAALAHELRAADVTSYLLEETPQLFGPKLDVPIAGVYAIVDNIVFLRQVELGAELHRVAVALKTRNGPHDQRLHTFTVTGRGVRFGDALLAEAQLTGTGQGVAARARGGATKKKAATTRPSRRKKR